MEVARDSAGSTAEPESGWGVSLQGGGQGAGFPSAVAYAGQGCGHEDAAPDAVSYAVHGGGQGAGFPSAVAYAGQGCGQRPAPPLAVSYW